MIEIHPPVTVPHSVATLLWELRQGSVVSAGSGPIGTGFEPLDSVLEGGLLPGEVVVLGGQPGVGKTICALQWARNVANHDRRVTFACFEHDESTLFNRLLVQELAHIGHDIDSTERIRARSVIRDLTFGVISLPEAVASCPVVEMALASLDSISPRLQLLRASAHRTTPSELDTICRRDLDVGGVLFVDYLQKVPIPSAVSLDDRIYQAAESLKELAVAHQITVVALSATAASGINVDRLRLKHLRGSDALAHECDVAILMNRKATAVSERHLKFDLSRLDEARKRTILSIEKNRRGEVDVHLEFVNDLANFRFHPRGAFTVEALEED